jgi:hypothetical protein
MTSLFKIFDYADEDDGLERWRERVGHDVSAKITNDAANRGNALHDYNELYLKNKLVRSHMKGDARTLFNRCKRYLDEVQLVIATEAALWNKDDKYAGRVDGLVMMANELTILDHKNSRNPININLDWGRKKMFKYILQCVGYGRAVYKMKGYQPTKGCLIIGNHLSSTSSKKVFNLSDFEEELDIVVEAYHGDSEIIRKSMYFKL